MAKKINYLEEVNNYSEVPVVETIRRYMNYEREREITMFATQMADLIMNNKSIIKEIKDQEKIIHLQLVLIYTLENRLNSKSGKDYMLMLHQCLSSLNGILNYYQNK